MRYLGGHLGALVSPLVDGQVDQASADRAWAHVHGCPSCRAAVEREGWVKTQLATIADEDCPPPQLVGSLYCLGAAAQRSAGEDASAAWAAVREIEHRGRNRRRTGIALVGAGSVSVAMFGLASLSGTTLGIGNVPTAKPTVTTTTFIAPTARVPGMLPSADLSQPAPTLSPSPSRTPTGRPRAAK